LLTVSCVVLSKCIEQLAHYGSVRDLLVRQTRLPVSLLLSLAIDAAEGLKFLHGHNNPHKNIAGKPSHHPSSLHAECCWPPETKPAHSDDQLQA
jgi:hypothetical protein